LAELDGRNEDIHELMTENQHLRDQILQLKLQMKMNISNLDVTTIDEPVLEQVEDFLASKLKAAHAEITVLLKYSLLLLFAFDATIAHQTHHPCFYVQDAC